jgi:hypothetical protein
MNAQNAQNAIADNIAFAYIESTIEPGMTIQEFRLARPKQPGRFRRLAGQFSPSARRQVAAA